jgi:hypothetical protein
MQLGAMTEELAGISLILYNVRLMLRKIILIRFLQSLCLAVLLAIEVRLELQQAVQHARSRSMPTAFQAEHRQQEHTSGARHYLNNGLLGHHLVPSELASALAGLCHFEIGVGRNEAWPQFAALQLLPSGGIFRHTVSLV